MESTRLQKDVTRYLDQIEAEMRRIGMWQTEPLRPEQLEFTKAFAMDTMPFSQWLEFIFLPRVRVREAVAANSFPKGSSVGPQAVRELDGQPEAEHLLTLLSEFDALFK
jgi:uncharacterized protein YqcC (DUF446 family)